MSTLHCVGIGPGSVELLTTSARRALESAEFVVGYSKYVRLIEPLLTSQEVFTTGMRRERERALWALEQTRAGRSGAIVSSGDSCVYGICGLVLELATEEDLAKLDIRIEPGLTAAVSAASLLGAPLMNDYVSISLSDLLTPRETILKRIEAALEGDLVMAIYNPKSRKRTELFFTMIEMALDYRKPETPVGIVTSAHRQDQEVTIASLGDMRGLGEKVQMNTVLYIGNSVTYSKGPFMITPRGYI